MGAAQAQTAAPKAAAAAALRRGKALYPQAQFDTMLKQRLAQGQPDSPELRNAVREELNTRELLAREAKKAGLDKNADVKTQMDLASQTVLVRAFVADWIKKNPIPDADLRKEYDVIKAQIGDKEYKVKHILVEKEDEAKDIIVAAAEGREVRGARQGALEGPGLEGQRRRSRLERAGRLRQAVLATRWSRTPKGKFTTVPVQTQFGCHVILVDDIRDAKVPPFDEVKPQLQQRMQAAAPRQVLQGTARQERRVTRRAASASMTGRAARPALFLRVAPRPSGGWPGSRSMLSLRPNAKDANPGGAVALIRHPKDFWAGLLFIAVRHRRASSSGSQYNARHRGAHGAGLLPAHPRHPADRAGRDHRAARAARCTATRSRRGNGGRRSIVLGSVVLFGLIVTNARAGDLDGHPDRRGERRQPRFRPKEALISGVLLAALAVGVFVVGLKLQLPIWPESSLSG